MTDLSKLSDAELQALYGQAAPQQPDLSQMPDDQLLAAYKAQQPAKPAYSGTVLPMSRDEQGNVAFDSNAGIFGLVKRALTGAGSALALPGDVATGKVSMTGEDGHTNPQVIDRAVELAALASPVNPMVRAGDKMIPGQAMAMARQKPAVPTTRELADAGAGDFTAARNSGLEVTSDAIANWSRQQQAALFEKGIHPVDAPATFAKLKELESAAPGSFATASNLQSLRESLGNTAQNFNPTAAKDQLAASRAISGLDGLLPGLDEASVLAGSPAATAQLQTTGRGNYAAAMRSNDLTGALDRANTGILERAQARAQAANSGRNLDNTIRSKVVSLLEKPKEVSGFSDAEIAILNNVAAGSPTRNIARYVGNVLGGGGGLGQAVSGSVGGGVGAMFGGVPGAVIGASIPLGVGAAAKSIANSLAKRSLSSADEAVRMRSPLYEERLAASPMETDALLKRSLIERLLLGGAVAPEQ